MKYKQLWDEREQPENNQSRGGSVLAHFLMNAVLISGLFTSTLSHLLLIINYFSFIHVLDNFSVDICGGLPSLARHIAPLSLSSVARKLIFFPELVLSSINRGINQLGEILYSYTHLYITLCSAHCLICVVRKQKNYPQAVNL